VGGRCFYLLNDSGITSINTFGGETKTRKEGTSLDGFYRVAIVLEECLWCQPLVMREEICNLCSVF